MTEEEIRAKYKKLHDDLTEVYYGGISGLTKEQFDTQHGKIWADMDTELIAGGYLVINDPDYVKACELLHQSSPVITQPDMWWLVRELGKKLGYKF